MSITIWHVKALYEDNKKKYQVLPYNLCGVIRMFLHMENGFAKLYLFMKDSRLFKKHAQGLADKYNK